MVKSRFQKTRPTLLGATAMSLILSNSAVSQETPPPGNPVNIPIGVNTEPDNWQPSSTGFSISLDGETLIGDPQFEDRIRRTDIDLAQANVRVTVDGLGVEPRLTFKRVGSRDALAAGEPVTLRSETNYPAFLEAGEFRIIDRGAVGGPRLLLRVPVAPNGQATFILPDGDDVVAVHRVTNSDGRYDETEALSLMAPEARSLSLAEQGTSTLATQNIPVRGGAITVSSDGSAPGSTLRTLGEEVQADASGSVVIQRILPPGDYDVGVSVNSNGRRSNLVRPVTIPESEWFYAAIGDLTYGLFTEGGSDDYQDRTTGRLAFYVDGKTAFGYNVTTSLDTGEGEIDEIFSRLDEKDPREVLRRVAAEDSFPTFGDDSQITDNTPTSGKIYLRVERDGNFLLWGDYEANLAGSGYLRNERSLYGAQLSYETRSRTSSGEARASLDLYGAQPDQLAAREIFQGTGGSVYFLQRQDITSGTETLTVELRDADTGRVIDQTTLVAGRDYQLNYIQGAITLNQPLTAYINPNLIQTNPGGDTSVNLVAQYEYTPTSTDVDGFSYGGRAETWVNDTLRLGVSALQEETGTADQTSVGVDVRAERGENSFIQLDYAESDGPGFGSSFSSDGGLKIDNTAASAGSGIAYKIEAQADLQDFSGSRRGIVGGYFEDREEGFSTLDYQVDASTGDERLFGAYAMSDREEGLGYKVYFDGYDNDVGHEKTEVGAELSSDITESLAFALGVEYLDEITATTAGDRTDVAGRLDYELREGLTLSAFGQGAVATGGLDEFNRLGVGATLETENGWSLAGEISDGDGGFGARALVAWSDDANNSSYFGYELDAGRALDAGVSQGDNGGKYVLGGRRQVSDQTALITENTYDIFGTARNLTSVYGVEYVQNDFLAYDAALEVGQVEDTANGNFDRRALSFGVRFDDSDLTGRVRLEFREERATAGSTRDDLDAIYLIADARYSIDENRRILFSFDAAETITDDEASLLNGTLVDASIGYALRPVLNERLNILASYRYLYDMFGQEVDGVEGSGPVQESHIANLEGSYDLSGQWTLGAKIGGRWTDSAESAADPLVSNDAWQVAANVRFNVVHNWDALLEVRHFAAVDADFTETGALAAVYRHFGNNAKVGIGYNFSNFSDDLADLTFDDQGIFINLVAKF